MAEAEPTPAPPEVGGSGSGAEKLVEGVTAVVTGIALVYSGLSIIKPFYMEWRAQRRAAALARRGSKRAN